MGFIDFINRNVNKQEWNYLKFFQLITAALVLNLLLFFVWILSLSYSNLIEKEFLDVTLRELGYSTLVGCVTGLILGFSVLFPGYIKKQWDLHQVVPTYLYIQVLLLVIVVIVSLILPWNAMEKNGFIIGYAIGALIVITAYVGEVEKEHSGNENQNIN
ncbi:MAG: hypothetical protein ACW98K_04920 [Candidatus Kariarchaeaceae archaeon]|jgi:hypothetical protein